MASSFQADGFTLDGQWLRTLLLAIERAGFEPRDYLGGLSVRLSDLAQPRAEVRWDDLVEVLERFGRAHDREALGRVAALAVELHPGTRLLMGFLLPPRLFFRVCCETLEQAGMCSVTKRPLPNDGFEVQLELDRRWRPSRAFFELFGLAVSALPEVLGSPRTRVEVVEVTPGRGTFRVLPGAAQGFALPATDAQLSAILALALDASSRSKRRATRAPVPTVAALEARFDLTRAEARVARRLAMGRSLKHIAKELDISPETARTHAKRAMQKTHTHRQAELVSVVLGLRD